MTYISATLAHANEVPAAECWDPKFAVLFSVPDGLWCSERAGPGAARFEDMVMRKMFENRETLLILDKRKQSPKDFSVKILFRMNEDEKIR